VTSPHEITLDRGPGRSEFKLGGQRNLLYKDRPNIEICHVIARSRGKEKPPRHYFLDYFFFFFFFWNPLLLHAACM
jgi:hypothetical protein